MREWATDEWDSTLDAGLRLIAQGVRSARLRHGLSQRQLAWRVGLNQSTISRLETARLGSMRLKTLARLLATLRTSTDDLMEGEPPRPRRRLPGQERP